VFLISSIKRKISGEVAAFFFNKTSKEGGKGLVSMLLTDKLDAVHQGGLENGPLELVGLFRAEVLIQEKNNHQIPGYLFGQVLEVVGKREEYTDDEKGEANDRDRKDVAAPVLPEAVQGLAEKVLDLFVNQTCSFPMIFPA